VKIMPISGGGASPSSIWDYTPRKLTEDPKFLFGSMVFGQVTSTSGIVVDLLSVTGKGILDVVLTNSSPTSEHGVYIESITIDGGTAQNIYYRATNSPSNATYGYHGFGRLPKIYHKSSALIRGSIFVGGTLVLTYGSLLFSEIKRITQRWERFDEIHDILIKELYDEKDKLKHVIREMHVRKLTKKLKGKPVK
jgi:hypothetical protein